MKKSAAEFEVIDNVRAKGSGRTLTVVEKNHEVFMRAADTRNVPGVDGREESLIL